MDFPSLQTQLWDRLRHVKFEDVFAMIDLQISDIFHYLNCEKYFEILNMPLPIESTSYLHYLQEDGIVVKQDNGLYAITNLGAILFAKRISDFSRVGRKALRIVQYEGNSRLTILKEDIANEGDEYDIVDYEMTRKFSEVS
mgnify:CR=1 FL=1